MSLQKLKDTEDLYPIEYEGKLYYEKDCDPVFVGYYQTRFGLNALGGVYLCNDDWVYPDGTIEEF